MNVPTFEEVMQLTRTIGAEVLFDDEESRAYYDVCRDLPEGASVVEIGMSFGRSSSIVLQIGAARGYLYTGVDPYALNPEELDLWQAMAWRTGMPSNRIRHERCNSDVAELYGPYAMALIDGNHDTDWVTKDCARLMPLIQPGGFICMHDYNRTSLPGVKWGADATLAQDSQWELAQLVHTLAVWRKKC